MYCFFKYTIKVKTYQSIILYELFQQNEYILSLVKFDIQEIGHDHQIIFVCV